MNSLSLIDQLLADQQGLTAVDRFSHLHDAAVPPLNSARYRDLIPLERPKHGEQYAFEVELDKCSGCKACVTACHSLNGLDDNETWRDVGLLVTAPAKPWKKIPAVQQHVTTACHHCVEPGCLEGCPVLAYEKDAVTGIVRHLDDQCIGCQYCVLKCPYDVPKYNPRLGIVRKCDMCSSRLAVAEAPACVQACPNEAIRITKVSQAEVTVQFRERAGSFLTGAPAGDYTLPTTRYVGGSVSGQGADGLSSSDPERIAALTRSTKTSALIPADAADLKPQPAHWPLVLMLVLSQASVGVTVLAATQRSGRFPALSLSLLLGLLGTGASVFHLGRPLGAWRSFLNLKRSWMSREIVAFSAYLALLTASVGATVSHQLFISDLLTSLTALIGTFTVFCSAMIYHDTRRLLWRARRTLPLFAGTAIVLGSAVGIVSAESPPFLAAVLIVAAAIKLALEISVLRHVTARSLTPLKKTALLIAGRLQNVAWARLICGLAGGVGLPLFAFLDFSAPFHAGLALLSCALLLAGEILERFLFFTTVVAPKMPGGVSS